MKSTVLSFGMPAFQSKVIRFLTQSHWRISRRTICSYLRLIQDSNEFKPSKVSLCAPLRLAVSWWVRSSTV